MVHCLEDMEGIQREDKISVAMVTAVLEDMLAHLLPLQKYWVRDRKTW